MILRPTPKSAVKGLLVGVGALMLTAAAPAPDKSPPSPQDIADAAPATAWRDIPPDQIVIMTLADGAQVDFQLAPAIAPVHVANIRQMVRSGYFDGAVILRVQDNYVVQWGRNEDDKTQPTGIDAHPPAEYDTPEPVRFKALPYRDAYAAKAGYIDTWPAATDGKAHWLVHCYGMIGVGRDMPPDTGTGAELYTVIGHAPRHLDRNLAVVGRVVMGMEALTARPRGSEALGFYKTDAERIRIVSVKLASDIAADQRPAFQVLDPASPTFDAWVKARANRTLPFFVRPAGAVDICNAQPPIRKTPR